MKIYYADYQAAEPKQTTCEKLEFPGRDADGRTMYQNTHFVTKLDAWDKMIVDQDAHIHHLCRRMKELEEQLTKVRNEIVRVSSQKVETTLARGKHMADLMVTRFETEVMENTAGE